LVILLYSSLFIACAQEKPPALEGAANCRTASLSVISGTFAMKPN
jgi:hypothetical protein